MGTLDRSATPSGGRMVNSRPPTLPLPACTAVMASASGWQHISCISMAASARVNTES